MFGDVAEEENIKKEQKTGEVGVGGKAPPGEQKQTRNYKIYVMLESVSAVLLCLLCDLLLLLFCLFPPPFSLLFLFLAVSATTCFVCLT